MEAAVAVAVGITEDASLGVRPRFRSFNISAPKISILQLHRCFILDRRVESAKSMFVLRLTCKHLHVQEGLIKHLLERSNSTDHTFDTVSLFVMLVTYFLIASLVFGIQV